MGGCGCVCGRKGRCKEPPLGVTARDLAWLPDSVSLSKPYIYQCSQSLTDGFVDVTGRGLVFCIVPFRRCGRHHSRVSRMGFTLAFSAFSASRSSSTASSARTLKPPSLGQVRGGGSGGCQAGSWTQKTGKKVQIRLGWGHISLKRLRRDTLGGSFSTTKVLVGVQHQKPRLQKYTLSEFKASCTNRRGEGFLGWIF